MPINRQYMECQNDIFGTLAPKLIQAVGAFSKNIGPALTELLCWQPSYHGPNQFLARFQILVK